MSISKEERAKALFITEYRNLCEKYGLMVAIEEGDDEEYDPIEDEITVSTAFTLVKVDHDNLNLVIQQLLIEDVRELEDDLKNGANDVTD